MTFRFLRTTVTSQIWHEVCRLARASLFWRASMPADTQFLAPDLNWLSDHQLRDLGFEFSNDERHRRDC